MRSSQLAWFLYGAYVLALAFGVGGIAIALQKPELWAHLESGRAIYAFGMQWGGTAYIVLGAAATFLYAWYAIGPRRTVIFFTVSVLVSLTAELIGTSTGWPFGNYSYTSGLGWKILDRVPFTIPLSWFTVGLSSYLLAIAFSRSALRRLPSWSALPVGVWLLVVWDLVLDPAMAHDSMQARFWVWHERGSYYGMPVINFLGWALTGLVFMSVSRRWWGQEPPRFPVTFPWAVYVSNVLFASALCAAVGLWGPILLATVGGLVPATMAAVLADRQTRSRAHSVYRVLDRPLTEHMAWRFLTALARLSLKRRVIEVRGLAQVPASGPVVLAPQHIHHLEDGLILLATVPRPTRFLVTLDWVPTRSWRWFMEFLCHLAGWPVIIRPTERERPGLQYDTHEARCLLLHGLREAVQRVSAGQLLVVFPEGYPVIDPHLPGRRATAGGVKPGAIWIAKRAAARTGAAVPVVPVRLTLEDRVARVLFDTPLWVTADSLLSATTEELASRLTPPTDTVARNDFELAAELLGKDR